MYSISNFVLKNLQKNYLAEFLNIDVLFGNLVKCALYNSIP